MKIILFAVTLLLLLSIGAASAEENKISQHLFPSLTDNKTIPVIILLKDQPVIATKVSAVSLMQEHAGKTQKALKEVLEKARRENKAANIESLWIVNAIAVNASPELIYSIASRSDVASIEPVRKMHIVEEASAATTAASVAWGVSRINAPLAWGSGIDGRGINVSVIDTGINASHPDIAGRVIKWKDYIGNINSAYDDNGHGTHVAGTVGGNGNDGIKTGVAPNVSLFGVKALGAGGSGTEDNVINGIQWSIVNKADIVSMSVGTEETWTTSYCDLDDPAMAYAINNAVNAGVVVVAAAGNSASGVSSPGCIHNAIAAGAVDSSDIIAGFSGRGSAMFDHGVVAPGVGITSLDYHSDGYLGGWSGTSMATPHVSGTAALVLQSNPGLTPLGLKLRLASTSVDLGTFGRDNIYGAGRIDAYRAIFISAPTPTPTPTAAPTPTPTPTTAAIFGTVFNDKNGNKIRDTGEEGLAGWTIKLSGFAGGKIVSQTAITNAGGNYGFTGLNPGNYYLSERFVPGWIATTQSFNSVKLISGDSVERNFGNKRIT